MRRVQFIGVVMALIAMARPLGAAPAMPALRFTEVASGLAHTCGLTAERQVYCWGSNYLGQLGDGSTADRHRPVLVRTAPGFRQGEIVAVSAGLSHTCALTIHGTVYCWGYNGSGRLGDGTSATLRSAPTPSARPPIHPGSVRAISAGGKHTCVVTADTSVYCWGENADGQLGDGTLRTDGLPRRVVALRAAARMVTTGVHHTCVLTHAQELFCFGSNYTGQLGDGTRRSRPVPALVNSGDGLTQGQIATVDAGAVHTCATDVRGSTFCWGSNRYGQLGDGSIDDRTEPASIFSPATGRLLAHTLTAGGRHTCMIDRSRVAHCWGDNTTGQLGTGMPGVWPVPLRVQTLSPSVTLRSLSAGEEHTCATDAEARAACWGSNGSGRGGWGETPPAMPIPYTITR